MAEINSLIEVTFRITANVALSKSRSQVSSAEKLMVNRLRLEGPTNCFWISCSATALVASLGDARIGIAGEDSKTAIQLHETGIESSSMITSRPFRFIIPFVRL
jgi:hypothetical protein